MGQLQNVRVGYKTYGAGESYGQTFKSYKVNIAWHTIRPVRFVTDPYKPNAQAIELMRCIFDTDYSS